MRLSNLLKLFCIGLAFFGGVPTLFANGEANEAAQGQSLRKPIPPEQASRLLNWLDQGTSEYQALALHLIAGAPQQDSSIRMSAMRVLKSWMIESNSEKAFEIALDAQGQEFKALILKHAGLASPDMRSKIAQALAQPNLEADWDYPGSMDDVLGLLDSRDPGFTRAALKFSRNHLDELEPAQLDRLIERIGAKASVVQLDEALLDFVEIALSKPRLRKDPKVLQTLFQIASGESSTVVDGFLNRLSDLGETLEPDWLEKWTGEGLPKNAYKPDPELELRLKLLARSKPRSPEIQRKILQLLHSNGKVAEAALVALRESRITDPGVVSEMLRKLDVFWINDSLKRDYEDILWRTVNSDPALQRLVMHAFEGVDHRYSRSRVDQYSRMNITDAGLRAELWDKYFDPYFVPSWSVERQILGSWLKKVAESSTGADFQRRLLSEFTAPESKKAEAAFSILKELKRFDPEVVNEWKEPGRLKGVIDRISWNLHHGDFGQLTTLQSRIAFWKTTPFESLLGEGFWAQVEATPKPQNRLKKFDKLRDRLLAARKPGLGETCFTGLMNLLGRGLSQMK